MYVVLSVVEYLVTGRGTSVGGVCSLSKHIPVLGTVPFKLRRILTVFITGLAPVAVVTTSNKLSRGRATILLRGTVFVTKVTALVRLCPV